MKILQELPVNIFNFIANINLNMDFLFIVIFAIIIIVNLLYFSKPVLRNYLSEKVVKGIQWGTMFISGLILALIPIMGNEVRAGNENKYLIKAENSLIAKDWEKAKTFLDSAYRLYPSNTKKASLLLAQMDSANSMALVDSALLNISNEDFRKLQDGSYFREFINNEYLNEKFLGLLSKHVDRRSQLIANAGASRKEKLIQEQFSEGKHKELQRRIKSIMLFPESFEHVKTDYQVKDNYIDVWTVYRAKNSSGKRKLNYKEARFSIGGEMIGFIDN